MKYNKTPSKFDLYIITTLSPDYTEVVGKKGIKNVKLGYSDDLICPNCNRSLPNKSFYTRKGQMCMWCDTNNKG
jgi:hypothetical protein